MIIRPLWLLLILSTLVFLTGSSGRASSGPSSFEEQRAAYFLTPLFGGIPATDSASSATAIATGYKTDGGNVAWLPGDPPGGSLTTIAETLRADYSFAIGVGSTVPFTHATPASFVSHHTNRSSYGPIGLEIITQVQPEVVIGGGHPLFGSYSYVGDAATWNTLKSVTAYQFVERTAAQDGAQLLDVAVSHLPADKKLFAVFGGAQGSFDDFSVADAPGSPQVTRSTTENPTLADVTRAALQVLDRDEDGFFVMLEQGFIDWANHENNFRNMIGGVYDLEMAVQAAEAFVDQPGGPTWADTLLIVTADHSNSYLRLPIPLGKGDLPVQVHVDRNVNGRIDNGEWSYPGGEATYRTTGHTNELVSLWARGAGAGLFKAYAGSWYAGTQIVDNTQIYRVMSDAVDGGVQHVILFIGDGMHIEHEIAASRYLYGEDLALAWHDWGALPAGFAGYAATWDVTTYNRYAAAQGAEPFSDQPGPADVAGNDPLLGYHPLRGGATPFSSYIHLFLPVVSR